MSGYISWPKYISFCTIALIFTLAGSQCVHMYYRPLNDLEELIEIELEKRLKKQSET